MEEKSCILPEVRLAEPVAHENLAMYPLFGTLEDRPDYLVLDQAVAGGHVRITEVSEHGSVPDLKLANTGDMAVLLLDGEELVGAKQNRVLNVTILAKARSEVVIPVSCVEAGRWGFRSREFTPSRHVHHASGRHAKLVSVSESLSGSGQRRSDQGAVWADIDQKARRMGVHSDTSAMADIFEHNRGTLDAYLNVIRVAEGQVGAVFAIGGRVIGMDLFDFPTTCAQLLPKIVHAYALDALDEARSGGCAGVETDPGTLLNAVRSAEARPFPAVGEGTDVRLSGPAVAGAALRARGRTVHLCAFARGGSEMPTGRASRIARPSRRRSAEF